jgi:hypothetical protein
VDFILGNNGLNSYFKASTAKPVSMYVNDFDLNGSVEQIICAYNGDKSYPVAMMDDLVKQIPSLSEKFKKFDDYKDATIENLFSADVLDRSVKLKACTMQSCVMMNTGQGAFRLTPLPVEAQFSPVYAIIADDFDHDGICDIVIGGNQYRAKPETGINDASYGLFLKGNKDGTWKSVSSLNSGIFIKGEIRSLKNIIINGKCYIVVARNNDNLQFYKY